MDRGQRNGLVGGREITLRQESVDGGSSAVVSLALYHDYRQTVISSTEWMYTGQRQQLTVITYTENTQPTNKCPKQIKTILSRVIDDWYTGS